MGFSYKWYLFLFQRAENREKLIIVIGKNMKQVQTIGSVTSPAECKKILLQILITSIARALAPIQTLRVQSITLIK